MENYTSQLYDEFKNIHEEDILEYDVENYYDLKEFVDFLNSKDKLASKSSVSGIMPAGLWMSDDFDEPLEMFQEYMQ